MVFKTVGGVDKVYHAYESDHTSSQEKEDFLLRASFLFWEDAWLNVSNGQQDHYKNRMILKWVANESLKLLW